jgi:hypothetical protein
MNKELLVKIWIGLTTGYNVLFVLLAPGSFCEPTLLLLFIIQLFFAISAVIISLKARKEKAPPGVLLILGIVSFLMIALFFLASVFVQGCVGPSPPIQLNQLCRAQLEITCMSNSTLPQTWNYPTMRQPNTNPISCSEVMDCSTCQECGFNPS